MANLCRSSFHQKTPVFGCCFISPFTSRKIAVYYFSQTCLHHRHVCSVVANRKQGVSRPRVIILIVSLIPCHEKSESPIQFKQTPLWQRRGSPKRFCNPLRRDGMEMRGISLGQTAGKLLLSSLGSLKLRLC